MLHHAAPTLQVLLVWQPQSPAVVLAEVEAQSQAAVLLVEAEAEAYCKKYRSRSLPWRFAPQMLQGFLSARLENDFFFSVTLNPYLIPVYPLITMFTGSPHQPKLLLLQEGCDSSGCCLIWAPASGLVPDTYDSLSAYLFELD